MVEVLLEGHMLPVANSLHVLWKIQSGMTETFHTTHLIWLLQKEF